MASQISHIVYAKKYFEALETGSLVKNSNGEEKISYPLGKLNKDEFLLGCVFPDIRRIDENVKRKDTHMKFLPLNLDFSGLTSFQAGWKFHLWCDMKREKILNDLGFYKLQNTSDLYNFPSKILEDEFSYGEYNNWEKLKNYFNNPPFLGMDISISRETYNLWYAMIARYIENNPNEKSMRIFLSKNSHLPASLDEIMKKIILIKQDKKAVELLKKISQKIIYPAE
ncbi:MAG TPA: hypothetical protein P5262_00460 [Candidatus Moranbacteria bacterium]|nr:hypothetical protein [Candidatus Moranbacteria bacterium]